MGGRSRFRRVAKWVGIVCSVLLLVAYIASAWWEFGLQHTRGLVAFGEGGFSIVFDSHYQRGYPVTLYAERYSPRIWFFIFSFGPNSMSEFDLTVPIWVLIIVAGVPTAILWYRDRRRFPLGHCRNCGYDLTGNVSGTCPECGKTA